jgi:UMF1 family MFS transporter
LSDRAALATPPVTRREIVAWAMFDFANSSYTTIIVTVAFSVFFTRVVAAGPAADLWWGRGVWASNIVVLLLSPLIGALSDESGRKKQFLAATYLLCCAATAALAVVGPGDIALALVLFVLSNLAFSFGENLVASFLPEISTPENVGRISGFGWGLGYFGGLASLLLVKSRIDGGFTVGNLSNLRQAWVITAIFFLVAGLPTFLILRERAPRRSEPLSYYVRNGFGRLADSWRATRQFQQLVRFLVVFFVFSMGLTSIIAFVGVYAERTVGFSASELIFLFLLVQISSALGAFAFGAIEDKIGARRTIQLALVIWIAVCATVWATTSKEVFWGVALFAGLGIGSLQSASRAMVGLFAPVDKAGEFFGLWGLAGKGSYAFGPLVFGWISTVTGSQKASVLVTGCFFVAGLIGMFAVDEKKGVAAAEAWSRRVAVE